MGHLLKTCGFYQCFEAGVEGCLGYGATRVLDYDTSQLFVGTVSL